VKGALGEVGKGAVQLLELAEQQAGAAARGGRAQAAQPEREFVVQAVGRGEAQPRRPQVADGGAALGGMRAKEGENAVAAFLNAGAVARPGGDVQQRRGGFGGQRHGVQNAPGHPIHRDQIQARFGMRHHRAQTAEADQRDECGEGGGAVYPAGGGMAEAGGDDGRAQNAKRQIAPAREQQLLGQALREGVGVGMF